MNIAAARLLVGTMCSRFLVVDSKKEYVWGEVDPAALRVGMFLEIRGYAEPNHDDFLIEITDMN